MLSRGSRTALGKETLLEATERHAAQTAAVAEQMTELRAYVDSACAQPLVSAQAERAGVSFSLALLDERGDGVTISAIAGRTDTRVYAKGVAAGKGEHELSPEESQAVAAALHKERGGLLKRQAS